MANKQKHPNTSQNNFQEQISVYERLINTSTSLMFVLNNQSEITFINNKANITLGYKTNDLLGKDWFSICNMADTNKALALIAFKEALSKKQIPANNFESELITKDKRYRLIKWTTTTDFDEKENLNSISLTGEDITSYRHLVAQLKISDDRHRTLIDNSLAGIVQVAHDGGIIYVNQAMANIFGYDTQQEMLSLNIEKQFLYPEKWGQIQHKIESQSFIQNFEAEFYSREKRVIHIIFNAVAKDGILTATLLDLTEQKQKEWDMQLLKYAVNNGGDEVYVITRNATFLWVNQRSCSILGYTAKELLNLHVKDVDPDFPTDKWHEHWQDLKENKFIVFETSHKTKEGKVYPVEIMANFIEFAGEELNFAFARDITGRKKAEETLRRNEEHFKRIFKTIQDGYFLMTTEGILQTVNPASLNILGYSDSCSLIHYNFKDTILANSNDFNLLIEKLNKEPELSSYPIEFKRQNNSCLQADCNIHLLFDSKQKPYAIEGTFRDVTERKWIEEALKSALKLNKIMQNLTEPEMINQGLEEGVRLTRSNIGFFHFVNDDAKTISLQTWSKQTITHCDVPDKEDHYPIQIAGIWADCIRQKKPVIHNNYASEKNKKGLPEGHFLLIREITVPIIEQNKVVAVIGVGNKESEYTQFDLNQLVFHSENLWSIIRRKQSGNELKIAKEAAEQANKAKSDFLANMSHEIRTPMNAVIGFADLINTQIEDPVQKSYVESIKSSGRTLLHLINDILDLSKIEVGKMDIQKEPTNLLDMFKEIQAIFSLKAEQKGIALKTTVPDDISNYFIIDEIRVRQILLNLIGNAVKFTDKGSVSLACNYENNTLYLIVEDTGIGISKEAHSKIFESFRQQEEQDIRKYGGTGLGLAITKRLIELMEGEILLESTPGVGSKFTVVLHKVKPTKRKRFIPDDFKYSSIVYEPATILVVDDIESNRNLIRGLLKQTKLDIIEAENGQQAVFMAQQKKPELILMDIRMPVLDGYQAAQQIRHIKELSRIPIIALTASINIYTKNEKLNNIFNSILYKPIIVSELHRQLATFLKFNRAKTSSSAKPVEPKAHKTIDIKQIHTIIQTIEKDILPDLPAIQEASSFDIIEEYANKIKELASKTDNGELLKFSNQLTNYIQSFDIENIQHHLKTFPQLISQLKNSAKDII